MSIMFEALLGQVAIHVPERLMLGRIIIDFDKQAVLKDGEILDLTQREYDLMCFMAQNPGFVIMSCGRNYTFT